MKNIKYILAFLIIAAACSKTNDVRCRALLKGSSQPLGAFVAPEDVDGFCEGLERQFGAMEYCYCE